MQLLGSAVQQTQAIGLEIAPLSISIEKGKKKIKKSKDTVKSGLNEDREVNIIPHL
jgi:hypothetical protein